MIKRSVWMAALAALVLLCLFQGAGAEETTVTTLPMLKEALAGSTGIAGIVIDGDITIPSGETVTIPPDKYLCKTSDLV